MQVQKFIHEKGWKALKDELSIEVKEYDCGLRVLNYNQIESPKVHPVVKECRGLILDQDANVVSRSFDRFYNYGEGDSQNFSWDDTVVYEKADGSLIKVYWCNQTNRWEISTRGTAFAESDHAFMKGTFRQWVLNAMRLTENQFQWRMDHDKNVTLIMEYTGPENRIVTPYTEPGMVLLGVRYHDGREDKSNIRPHFEYLLREGMYVRLPRVYELNSAEDCIAALENLPDMQEGYVAWNGVDRVKLKSPRYVALHKLRGNGTPTINNICELAVTGEEDEFLTYFPEYKELFDPVLDAKNQLIYSMTDCYNMYKDIEVQKDFALSVKGFPYSGVLFKARKDKITPTDAFNQASVPQRVELLKEWMQ